MVLSIYGNFKGYEWLIVISLMILIGIIKGLLTYHIKLMNMKNRRNRIIISILMGVLYSCVPLWIWVITLILKYGLILLLDLDYSDSNSISKNIEKADLDKKYGLGEYFSDSIFHMKK